MNKDKKSIAVGGQAVIEGVMMRGPDKIATAIRRASGKIELKIQSFVSITQKIKFLGLPLIRGFVSLIEMMKIGVGTLTFSANRWELDNQEESKKQKSAAGEKVGEFFSYVISIGLAFLLFGVLPYKIADWVNLSKQNVYFNLVAGLIRITFFVIYLLIISKLKDIHRVFQYHGAEHKCVNAYEKDVKLNVTEIQKMTTLHPRCGTSFMFFVLLISILIFSIIDTLAVAWIFHAPPKVLVRLGYHLLFFPLISGVSYEILKLSGKNINHPLVKMMTGPGMALQRITTQPPEDSMIECALVAMKATLDMDYSEFEVTEIGEE